MTGSLTRRSFCTQAAVFSATAVTRRDKTLPGVQRVVVAPNGDDAGPGTVSSPMRTLQAAVLRARKIRQREPGAMAVELRGGLYEFADTLRLTQEDGVAADRPLRITRFADEVPVLSGGTRLKLHWENFRDGIWKAEVPAGTQTDQLFVNGLRQVLARYPDFDVKARYLNGTATEADLAERSKRWKNPAGATIHALQASLWGSLQDRVLGKNADGSLELQGGWQVDRNQPMHKEYRFIEGVFEELDAPGEWFLDEQRSTLYFYPPPSVDIHTASIQIVRLKHLVEVAGTASRPVRGLEFSGLTFQHSLRTFMETREPVLRSDWRLYRGGALRLEGAEDVRVQECTFDQMGGNAVFVNGYNRQISVRSSRVQEAGASAICFVGATASVRNALQTYGATLDVSELDRVPGPLTPDYPSDCLVEDCLISRSGRFEKQSAGVEIDIAQRITIRHCSVYEVPRAGINIGDGCWGGHIVDGCDVFDTVLETSDHGAFNSWGRDRWWHLRGTDEDSLLTNALTDVRALPTLDAMEPNTLTRTRWACAHGWDIDLDDGSTNYRITENLCLSGGIKLREGFFRVCENNVTVNNTLHVHVWPKDSRDVVQRNVFFLPYRPIRPRGWGKSFDSNFLHQPGDKEVSPAVLLQQISGQDAHSLEGDARFVDPKRGDFLLQPDSPVFRLNIHQLPAIYGVRDPSLRALARRPDLAYWLRVAPDTLRSKPRLPRVSWMGATLRNVSGLAEVSALGARGETGILVQHVDPESAAAQAGLQQNDLLVGCDDESLKDVDALNKFRQGHTEDVIVVLHILRLQKPLSLEMRLQPRQ